MEEKEYVGRLSQREVCNALRGLLSGLLVKEGVTVWLSRQTGGCFLGQS